MFYAPPLIYQVHWQCNLYKKKWCIKRLSVDPSVYSLYKQFEVRCLQVAVENQELLRKIICECTKVKDKTF